MCVGGSEFASWGCGVPFPPQAGGGGWGGGKPACGHARGQLDAGAAPGTSLRAPPPPRRASQVPKPIAAGAPAQGAKGTYRVWGPTLEEPTPKP